MSQNQITALSKVGRAYDFFQKAVQQALYLGISPEKIIDFLDAPEVQIANAAMRRIIKSEVMVQGDGQEQPSIETDDTITQPKVQTDDTVISVENDDTVISNG